MTEMQQILNKLEELEKGQKQIVTRLDTIETGQESIKTELHDTKKELTTKIDAVKEDTEAIRASLDIGTGSLSDNIYYLQHKLFNLEKEVDKLKRTQFEAK
jgi:uncharacterized protein YhaN